MRSLYKKIKIKAKEIDHYQILRRSYIKLKDIYIRINGIQNKMKWREHKKYSFSSLNKDKKIYIVRRGNSIVGLFSYFITTLGGIAYAEENGMIPVVDLQNYPNTYLFPEEVGKKNAWEFYFRQPGGISLQEALKSKNVILGPGEPTYPFPCANSSLFLNKNGELNYWRAICKKYIFLNESVMERLEKEKLIFLGKKVLGVSCRGTDYVAIRPSNHPVQPGVDKIIEKVEEALMEEGFEAIYLATEDQMIIAKFREKYGERLLLSNREYADYEYEKKDFITFYSTNRENDKYKQGMDYLVSMLLLRECKGLITTMASGTAGIMCLSGEFDYFYVFDLGYYQ